MTISSGETTANELLRSLSIRAPLSRRRAMASFAYSVAISPPFPWASIALYGAAQEVLAVTLPAMFSSHSESVRRRLDGIGARVACSVHSGHEPGEICFQGGPR